MSFLTGNKTYIIAVIAIIYAVAGYVSGNLDIHSAIQIVLASLGAMGIRNGITQEIAALGAKKPQA